MAATTDVRVVVRIRPPIEDDEENVCFFRPPGSDALAYRVDPFGVSPLCEEVPFHSVLDATARNDQLYRQLRLDDAVASTIQVLEKQIHQGEKCRG